MAKKRTIFCCGCNKETWVRLTDGTEIYPHRSDLAELPFWKCDSCGNHVGCHHKTRNRTRPLGCIPTKEVKNARQHIHRILDPLWKDGLISRGKAYKRVALTIGVEEYHTAEIRSVEEARTVYRAVLQLRQDLVEA
ncbi:zinc-finger-containing protein [Thalassospira alkalitolerans]|uniref:zinc-finger-containing protein n=1 Tax=Thalassospira alkalitolerans TaxID=1293890 RepID=UPI003AA841E8